MNQTFKKNGRVLNLKLVQNNYRSTGSVEHKQKGVEPHYSKLVRIKSRASVNQAGYHQKFHQNDEGSQQRFFNF